MAADGGVDRGRSAITEVTFAAEFEKFTLTYFVPREVLANTQIIIRGRFFTVSWVVVLKSCSTFLSVTYLFSVHAVLIQHITPGLHKCKVTIEICTVQKFSVANKIIL